MSSGEHHASWRKSSFSAANGACVEVAGLPGRQVDVRDSKKPAGDVLVVSADEWGRFVSSIKAEPGW
ncbi:DUF397 domain-containing protein [Nonomuraea endophytica]|uniref:DUF397 domain-containing protein n=1 Tax=Nonomuraea endophytica TaxID=714136 RepID=A0A7W7ZWY5_9ACTN|nr:DUF397 domain-containing protein [Nonomuraea endophytica]MBB5075330.1 hypothetical protein [Nonomuraea endophytica]